MKNKIYVGVCAMVLMMPLILGGCSNNSSKGDPSVNGTSNMEYARGKTTEAGYESEYLNLKFNAPEHYEMYPESILNESVEGLTDDFRNMKYEMISYFPDKATRMSLIDEKQGESDFYISILLATEKLESQDMTAEQYLAFDKERQTKRLGEDAFSDVTVTNDKKTTIAGKDYLTRASQAEYEGVEYIEECFVRKSDKNRCVSIYLEYPKDKKEEAHKALSAFTTYK